MNQKIYVDSVGIKIKLVCFDYNYVALDLTTATTLEMLVKKPDGDEVVWTATYTTNINPPTSSNEVMIYTTVEGDLDIPGQYLVQGKVITAAAETIFAETMGFTVFEPFT